MKHPPDDSAVELEAHRWASRLGGAPVPTVAPPEIQTEKALRKRRKREARLRADAERAPRSSERFRMLCEIIDQGRKIVELVDHKARYALVVVGVLNTGVFLLLSRVHLLDLPQGLASWFTGSLLVYAGLSFFFMYYALDCLRPRQMEDTGLLANARTAATWGSHAPLGLAYWETVADYDLEAYQQAWSVARMDQLNAEAVMVNHHLSRITRAKYVALGRLYRGLFVLVALAVLLVVVYGGMALFL